MNNLEFLAHNVPADEVARTEHARLIGEMDIMKQLLDYADATKYEIEEEENES